MEEKSCGTIPFTIKGGVPYYLLIKSKLNGDCGFPKGHIEADETEAETALRETWEETSVNVTVNTKFRYELSYQMKNGNLKTVVYFLASFENGKPRKNDNFEDFDYLILPFDRAYKELTFENAKQILRSANEFLTSALLKSSPVE